VPIDARSCVSNRMVSMYACTTKAPGTGTQVEHWMARGARLAGNLKAVLNC
jgi:hypothetical protein